MISPFSGSNTHPPSQLLALYSTGDLPWMARLQIRYHFSGCPDCKAQLSRFRSSLVELRREAALSTLPGFDWNRIEREMLGNIAVGVSAGRCVDKVGRKRSLFPGALVTAGLTLLFVIGWFTHIPLEQDAHLAESLKRLVGIKAPFTATVLQTSPEGIAVRSQGGTLTLMHPASAIVSSSGSSTVSARYVDETTGQVTVTNVYGE